MLKVRIVLTPLYLCPPDPDLANSGFRSQPSDSYTVPNYPCWFRQSWLRSGYFGVPLVFDWGRKKAGQWLKLVGDVSCSYLLGWRWMYNEKWKYKRSLLKRTPSGLPGDERSPMLIFKWKNFHTPKGITESSVDVKRATHLRMLQYIGSPSEFIFSLNELEKGRVKLNQHNLLNL